MKDEIKLKPEHVVTLAGAVGGGMHQRTRPLSNDMSA